LIQQDVTYLGKDTDSCYLSKGTGDSTKTSVKAVSLRAKIQTEQLPNTNLER